MFEITVHIPALDRLVDALNAQSGADKLMVGVAAVPAVVAEAAAQSAEGKAPATTRKPKASTQTASATTDTEVTVDAGPTAQTGASLSEPSMDDVKAISLKLVQKHGRDAMAAALVKFGAPAGVSTLPEENFGAYIAHCAEALT